VRGYSLLEITKEAAVILLFISVSRIYGSNMLAKVLHALYEYVCLCLELCKFVILRYDVERIARNISKISAKS